MNTINDLIATLTVASPARHRGLSVYPLKSGRARTTTAYLVLDEALATNQFRITEVSEYGSVPQLLAINDTSSPVFLLDGEELVGAKQNRVLNLSVMLAPNSKTEIPVSCVEAGRWRPESDAFRAAERVQFARGRAQKMEQVSQALHSTGKASSDQAAVWNAISMKSRRMHVESPTGAMAALFEDHRDDLQGYLDGIPMSDSQVGAVYAFGDSLIGIEVFDSDATFKKLAGKLLASYALDAIELNRNGEPPAPSAVSAFIDPLRVAKRQRSAPVGMGETVRLSDKDLVGAALEVAGGIVHLAAFRRQTFEDQHHERGLGRARILSSRGRARAR